YMLSTRVKGALSGVLPLVHMKSLLFGNFLVSLPFVTYGGLLCRDADSERVLLESAEELRARVGARHVELRHGDAELDLPAKRHKVAMLLPLATDEQAMWTGFNAKVRNQVRKAQKEGLAAQWGGGELLGEFYEVFVRNMRDLGTPVYSRDFFANVLDGLPHNTRLVVVRSRGKAVAAGLLYHHGTTLEIPWASSIRDFNSLCPNNLMYWECIRHGIALGLSRFDLGRSTPGAGTFKFKEQWGAKPEVLAWHYLLPKGGTLPNLTNQNPKYSLAIDMWQRLPLPVTRLIGPPIVRCIP
ncbi:MAG: FemAB family PEP-CTERM system-associated protein, partial [Desulfomicrobium sp.]|nr:FemAB family PEP-CTERM system-associated protein [Desulfomicrobium sp.]